jgi:hypothetical protein
VSGIHAENTISCWILDTAACASKAQASPLLFFIQWLGRAHPSPKHERKARQNRRAGGTSADGKLGGDEHSGLEPTSFSLVTGDHLFACRSAAKIRKHLSSSATTPWCLGGYDVNGIWVYLCDLWAALCSLWLIRVKWECGGPSFDVRAEAQIARAVV